MILVEAWPAYVGTGQDVRRCVIQADETPNAFPTTGEGVIGLPDEAIIAPTSIIHCVDSGKNYVLDENGTTWNEDGGGGSSDDT